MGGAYQSIDINPISDILILGAPRCPHRCKFCSYHTDTQHVTQERQSAEALARETMDFFNEREDVIRKNGEIYIINSGSLLDEKQIPREYISWLAGFLERKNLRLIAECRADSKLEDYSHEISALVETTLDVTFALGVEAYRSDLENRNALFRRLGKGITDAQCIEEAQKLHEMGCKVKAYLIIAPPWLGGPSYLEEGYRKSIDWLIETAFQTAEFAAYKMDADIIGTTPFFPYKGTNAPIPEDWAPVSATEAVEVANQLRQVLPETKISYSSRNIHLAFGNFFKSKGIEKPVNAHNPEEVLEARENVARICENVFGMRGEISKNIKRAFRRVIS